MSDPAPPTPAPPSRPLRRQPRSPTLARSADLTALVQSERPFLWGLALRITGSADADDVVQEAFARFLSHPPADQSAPLALATARVVTRLCHRRAAPSSSYALRRPLAAQPRA